MIKVGIHENVELIKAEINDKGTLVIGIKKGGGLSLAERLSSGSDGSSEEEEQDFFIWPVKLGEYVKTGEDVAREFESLNRMLKHILKGFLTTADIAKNFNPFNGIDLGGKTDAQVKEMLMTQDIMDAMYKNIANQFIEMVTPFLGKGMLFRVRLNRQSKLKNFSSLPKVGRYANLDAEGFWEGMDVKEEASNVKYSNYELGFRKGDKDSEDGKPSGVDLSSGAQTQAASAVNPEEEKAAEAMFGGEAPQ